MADLLVVIGVLIGLPGAFGPGLLFLIPQLNPTVWYRLGLRRTLMVGAGVVLFFCGWLMDASLVWVLILIPVLVGLRIFLRPEQVIRALEAPRYLPVDAVDLSPDEYVLAVEVEGEARAWPRDILIAHHLIHDTVAGNPLLASW